MFLPFDAAIEDVLLANGQCLRLKHFFAFIVEAERKPVLGIATDPRDDIRRIVDFHGDAIPANGDFVDTFGSFAQMLAKQHVDAAVVDTFVVGVPPAIFAKTNFSRGINRPESGFWHRGSLPAFQNQRHRSIIHELHRHVRLEFARGDWHLLLFHACDKILV
jgi:hypothetical protein